MFPGYPIELTPMPFCLAPKVFDAIDVVAGIRKLSAVVYAQMTEF
jgi:hypothetical protein